MRFIQASQIYNNKISTYPLMIDASTLIIFTSIKQFLHSNCYLSLDHRFIMQALYSIRQTISSFFRSITSETHNSKMDIRESVSNQNDVSLLLAKHLVSTKASDANLVFSPLSIQVLLGLIAVGSEGPTLNQLISFSSSSPLKNSILSHLSSSLSSLPMVGPLVGPDCPSSTAFGLIGVSA